MRKPWQFIFLLVLAAHCLMIGGCAGTNIDIGNYPDNHNQSHYAERERGGGPPPWAPAHGYRAKYQYQYYPSTQLYYDMNRGVYFYLSNGQWQVSSTLPVQMQMRGNKVTLEMNTDKPYQYHSEVIKRYPSGVAKNKGKGKK